MAEHPTLPPGEVLRHFTVAVFVVHAERVLLHYHRKLGRWLPPGGHIENNEVPDAAAVREVAEETGIRARLVGPRGLPIDEPTQLVVPAGIQMERIYPGHEHIDLYEVGAGAKGWRLRRRRAHDRDPDPPAPPPGGPAPIARSAGDCNNIRSVR